MPFNVTDALGRHIGYVAGKSPASIHGGRGLLVLLTEKRILPADVDLEKMRDQVASAYGAKTLFGNIKDDVYQSLTREALEAQSEDPDRQSEATALKLLLLKRDFDLQPFLKVETEGPGGYVLLDGRTLFVTRQGTLVLAEGLEYVLEERAAGGVPIHFFIKEMPEVELAVMGVGEGLLLGSNWSDFGGRNHTHQTRLTLSSGNVTTILSFPLQLFLQKGMALQLLLKEGAVTGLVTGGIHYRWSGL